MIGHLASGGLAQNQGAETVGGPPAVTKARVIDEAETAIEARIAKHDAYLRATFGQYVKARPDQGRGYSATLMVRRDRDRPKAKPPGILAINQHRRESSMTNDQTVSFRDERQGERSGSAQSGLILSTIACEDFWRARKGKNQ